MIAAACSTCQLIGQKHWNYLSQESQGMDKQMASLTDMCKGKLVYKKRSQRCLSLETLWPGKDECDSYATSGRQGYRRNSCLPALPSHSLGRHFAGHDLRTKLKAAASHGFKGIELVFEDLNALASELPGGPTPSNLLVAAEEIHHMTESFSLTIINLQAFSQYEGLISQAAHVAAMEKANLWFQLAHVLRTQLILIPSNFLPAEECTSDRRIIVHDMIKLADLGARENPPISFAFESLCWGTHIDNWEGVHAVVSAVNRWNFGYCLDTFNIAGRVYGDPASPDGKTAMAGLALIDSLMRLVECVDREKIFFIQVVDAERVSPPLTAEHPWYDSTQPARMSWSRNARLFAFEEERGGYLPIMDICKVLFDGLGYRGWVSFELFSRTLTETAAEVPEVHAMRAKRSWEKLVEAFPQIVSEETDLSTHISNRCGETAMESKLRETPGDLYRWKTPADSHFGFQYEIR